MCGADCNGTLLPAGPMLVASQLPDSNPSKALAVAYIEELRGDVRRGLGGDLRRHATTRVCCCRRRSPRRCKTAQPGTPAFRDALRDALETTNVAATHGVFTMSKTDHNGLDKRGRVMVMIDNGKWVLQK